MKRAIIMAAGKGTRMMSDLPKVMHKLCEKPMIDCLLDTLNCVGVDEVVSVLGYGKEIIEDHLKDRSMIAVQMPQLGTAHAAMQANQFVGKKGLTLVINGDCPLITKETFEALFKQCEQSSMVVLTTLLDNPGSYGRIIRTSGTKISKIVEAKDASKSELEIKEINTGIYCFDNEVLFKYLKEVKNENAQKEYYITDLVQILNDNGLNVEAMIATSIDEVQGINTLSELAQANKTMRNRINSRHMDNGVVMINPEQTYIGFDVKIAANTTIYPNVYLNGNTIILEGTKLLSNCYLENAIIGKNCTIDGSRITDSEIQDEVTIGPSAHIRMQSFIESKVRIGNFVELKNSRIGYDSRCAHLTYIGDSDIGSKVNIGCGVVTVNYDGKHKYRTTVKDGAFIGSNVNLIAPVTVGFNAVVAAGSTCNHDVEDGAMAIARTKQENKPGYGEKYKNKD